MSSGASGACYSRQRKGGPCCGQDRLPADRIEAAVMAAVLAELDDGSLFEQAAQRGRREWEEAHSNREMGRLQKKLDEKHRTLDGYLKAFERGDLPVSACSYRVKEVERDIAVLE